MSTPFSLPKPVRSTGGQRTAPPQQTSAPNQNVVKNGGGLNVNPSLNLSFVKANTTSSTAGPSGTAASAGGTGTGKGTPGADFMSNESIRAFSEHVRKEARNRAVERTLDAEGLEAVLRHIPTADGSMAGARLRSRRVSRHLKRIAKAEQLIAKEAAGLYAQFEREYEAELRKVGKARPKQPTRFTF